MKKIQILSILVLSGTVLFGGKATAHKAKVNFKESGLARTESVGSVADLMIDSDKAIHGLQFDIKYNPEEIKSITPQDISGFEVKYNELSDGLIRGLVFSLQGQALPGSLPFEFDNNTSSFSLDFIIPKKPYTLFVQQLSIIYIRLPSPHEALRIIFEQHSITVDQQSFQHKQFPASLHPRLDFDRPLPKRMFS